MSRRRIKRDIRQRTCRQSSKLSIKSVQGNIGEHELMLLGGKQAEATTETTLAREGGGLHT